MREENEDTSRQMVAPIVFKLLMSALDSKRTTSSITSQALSDAFSIARRSLDYSNSRDEDSHVNKMSYPQLIVLEWTKEGTACEHDGFNQVRYLRLNDDLLNAIQRLSTDEVVSVHGKFFFHLWKNSRKKTGGRVTLCTKS